MGIVREMTCLKNPPAIPVVVFGVTGLVSSRPKASGLCVLRGTGLHVKPLCKGTADWNHCQIASVCIGSGIVRTCSSERLSVLARA